MNNDDKIYLWKHTKNTNKKNSHFCLLYKKFNHRRYLLYIEEIATYTHTHTLAYTHVYVRCIWKKKIWQQKRKRIIKETTVFSSLYENQLISISPLYYNYNFHFFPCTFYYICFSIVKKILIIIIHSSSTSSTKFSIGFDIGWGGFIVVGLLLSSLITMASALSSASSSSDSESSLAPGCTGTGCEGLPPACMSPGFCHSFRFSFKKKKKQL